MSTAEIISQLSKLGPEDLAEVKAWLRHRDESGTTAVVEMRSMHRAHIVSPRLVDPACAARFIKQVTQLPAHAEL